MNWRAPRVLFTLTAPASSCFLPWLVSKPCRGGGVKGKKGQRCRRQASRQAGNSEGGLLVAGRMLRVHEHKRRKCPRTMMVPRACLR